MRLPRRPLKSIPSVALPSIHTTFPTNHGQRDSIKTRTPGTSATTIEDGIERVPIERENSSSAKILSPGTEEKEVVPRSKLDLELSRKPLPKIPQSRWGRLSIKQRIWVLFGIQLLMLMTVGLSLLAVKGKAFNKIEESPNVQFVSPNIPSPNPNFPPVKRGTFVAALGNAQQRSSACLSRNNESVAWTCTSNMLLQLTIIPSHLQPTTLALVSLGPLGGTLSNGFGQGPIEIDSVEIFQAMDTQAPSNSPGYYFQTTYNRTVMLKRDEIAPQGEIRISNTAASDSMHPGDDIWRCSFNETRIEGFIYVMQNSATANQTLNMTWSDEVHGVGLPYFPYVLKITEQRLSNSTPPYCEKMQVLSNGGLVSRSAPVILSLTDPGFTLQDSGAKSNATRQKRQQVPSGNNCRCQWMVQ